MATIIDNLLEMSRLFTEAATSDPLTGFLLAFGSLVFAFSFAIFGYLTLGAALNALTPSASRRAPPRAGR